jgi:hypothetical protein
VADAEIDRRFKRAQEILAKMPGVSREAIIAGAIESGCLFRADELVFEARRFELTKRWQDAEQEYHRLKAQEDTAFNEVQATEVQDPKTPAGPWIAAWKKYRELEALTRKAWDKSQRAFQALQALWDERRTAMEAQRP